VALDYVGEIPEDSALQRSVQAQRPVLEAFPSCRRRAPSAGWLPWRAAGRCPKDQAAGWNSSWNACCGVRRRD